jgi:hypothetical protein
MSLELALLVSVGGLALIRGSKLQRESMAIACHTLEMLTKHLHLIVEGRVLLHGIEQRGRLGGERLLGAIMGRCR